METKRSNNATAAQNLIRIALSIVKMKSAASHFETSIATHQATGANVGQIGHGRKQFNQILTTMSDWIDDQNRNILTSPSPSTGVPPHFYVTGDKSTPSRTTNQVVLLCFMYAGQRRRVVVACPEVYFNAEDIADDDNNDILDDEHEDQDLGMVTGAHAGELANSMVNEIMSLYGGDKSKGIVAGSWQGTTCDGQYQAAQFTSTINDRLERNVSVFHGVHWDDAHRFDLAMGDVKKGTVGQSKDFFANVVNFGKRFHKKFARGKMHASAKVLAKLNKTNFRVTTGTCATRFCTSQFREFQNLLTSFPVYVKSLRSGSNTGKVEDRDYVGQDHVFNICGVIDILAAFMKGMSALQDLACPCWKLDVYQPRIVSWMERLIKSLELAVQDFVKTEEVEFAPIFSYLHQHSKSIQQLKFRGIQLVKGSVMKKISDDLYRSCDRKLPECTKELKQFAEDILASLKLRSAASHPMNQHLKSLDLELLIENMAGERQPDDEIQMIEDGGLLEEFGCDGIKEFVRYLASLDHLQELKYDARMSNVLYRKLKTVICDEIWSTSSYNNLEWFVLDDDDGTTSLLDHMNSENLKYKSLKLNKFSVLGLDKLQYFSLHELFRMEFLSPELALHTFTVRLNEGAVYRSLLNPSDPVCKKLGPKICCILDVALAKGGPEAIAETFYSVMGAQLQSGGQANETLALRTKIDMSAPNTLQADRLVKEVSKMYLRKDEERGRTAHMNPVLSMFKKQSKVLERIQKEDPILPYLV